LGDDDPYETVNLMISLYECHLFTLMMKVTLEDHEYMILQKQKILNELSKDIGGEKKSLLQQRFFYLQGMEMLVQGRIKDAIQSFTDSLKFQG
jgi:hypothetical protein